MQPATIKLFLTDGQPAGIRTAEMSNWTGKAIAGPRSELGQFLLRDELLSPGVYFLTGVDAETDKPTLYIGEAENVRKRLKQHESKEWNQVVAFVSKDENLTKAHIRYLEGALIELANEAGRSLVLNNASSGAKLPESDQAEMDVFLEKILQLLPVSTVDAFKKLDNKPAEIETSLICRIKGLEARGKRTANGFVVYEGSQAVKEDRASANNWAKKRKQFIQDKILVEEGDCYVFSRDYEFTSPSSAAAVISGGSANGLIVWKTRDGILLKDLS